MYATLNPVQCQAPQWIVTTVLIVALVVYGLFGVPAPQNIGWPEIIEGGLLAVALFAALLQPNQQSLRTYEAVGLAAMGWLFSVPLLIGVAQGFKANDIVRDVLPALLLFLPLMLGRSGVSAAALSWALAFVGVAFGIRWWSQYGPALDGLDRALSAEGDDYLLNSPAVAFAAMWLPMAGFALIEKRPSLGRVVAAACASALGLFLLMALAVTAHRAAFGIACLVLTVSLAAIARRAPGAALAAVAVVVVVGLMLPLQALVGQLWTKTQQVGGNARIEEIEAVAVAFIQNPWLLPFGFGWGALIANPAVGGMRVSYTHAFTGFLLLKTGLFGAFAMAAYVASLMPNVFAAWRADRATVTCAAAAVLTGLTVHTNYKYLCFAMLLALVTLRRDRERIGSI